MMNNRMYELIFLVLPIFCLICPSLGFVPVDNYLINCGSPNDTTIDGRVFLADNLNSSILITPEKNFVRANANSVSSPDSDLYQTARVFNGISTYTFPIKKHGWHFVRLYFSPFATAKFNLSTAMFSVSAQTFTLFKNFQPLNSSIVKEYALNITSDSLSLTFTPTGSFAFLNGLEVISLPDELFPSSVRILGPTGQYENLGSHGLETVMRVNMGNTTISPRNDTLFRPWVADGRYLKNGNLVMIVRNDSAVNYTKGIASENIAPLPVYGSATRLHSGGDPNALINVTWSFDVDPGFHYFVRFHFCLITVLNGAEILFLNVFLDGGYAQKDLNLSVYGAPFYVDVVVRPNSNSYLNISIGPSDTSNSYPDGMLNGFEIMKISTSRGSLDAADSEIQSSTSASKTKVWIIVVVCVGAIFSTLGLVLLSYLVCRRKRRRANMVHTAQELQTANGEVYKENKNSIVGHRFPFAEVKEATDDFSESLVIGVGGFGKVYKGVLKDGTKVAVKRGASQYQQGIAEFRTEIEMLSQFRHRHLVSFTGYCDEKDEMIIVYEYMENGTLKNHLYGSELPKLSWRQRLEICIGSARGLHYLHTGSVKAIIHRDVKTANVLLDENYMAKVADFGLSKLGPEIDKTHVSTAVKGSFGYLDPEYLIRQQLTEKSDVYSFGVVMFEVLCGRPVIDPSLTRESANLVEWVKKSLKRGELENIVDPHLVGDARPESLTKFGETAEKCLAEYSSDRPTMGDVLWNLESALQLQGNDERNMKKNEVSDNISETTVSNTDFSTGIMGDLAGVSMSKVFSEMVKAERG